MNFSLSEFDAGKVHARELLSRLSSASPQVIVLVTQLRVQRALFAWAYDHGILFGPGFGWATYWADESSLHNDDGSVNASAVNGAQGVLGLRPGSLSGADEVVKPMVDLWRGASSSNCQGLAYCDEDGDPATWPSYAVTAVDAVLMYAHAMDALLRVAPQSMGNPDALYATMLTMAPFEGLAGPPTLQP